MDERRKERDRRLELFNRLMEQAGLDALIFTSTAQQTCQMAVKYATNYTLNTRRDFAYMARGGMLNLLVPTVGQQFHARTLSWLPEENIRCGDMLQEVLAFIRSLPQEHPRIGLYEPKELPICIYRELTDTNAEFVDITARLTELRAPKSEYELELIRAASQIAVGSFEWGAQAHPPRGHGTGDRGGRRRAFCGPAARRTVWCSSARKNPTRLSRAPRTSRSGPNEVFVYSCEMAGPGGYWTQMVRPIFLERGCAPEAYEVLQVIPGGAGSRRGGGAAGNRICDVDEAIAQVVKKRGCHAGVWSGHGMGADLGDGIDIGAPNKMELKPNMILTLHPSVVGRSDGLLYGNTYAVTETGVQNLTDAYTGSSYLEDLLEEMG